MKEAAKSMIKVMQHNMAFKRAAQKKKGAETDLK